MLQEAKNLTESKPAVLYVMIADECHWGPTLDGAHNRYINDEELVGACNLLLLLVSATPYNVLTHNSRVDQKLDEAGESNVVRWFQSGEKAETEYRSMEYYLDTVAFEVPPNRREARLKIQIGSEEPKELALTLDNASGSIQSQPLHLASMDAIAKLLSASLERQGIKKTVLVVKFSDNRFYLHRPRAPKKKTTVTLVFNEHSIWPLLGFKDNVLSKELCRLDDGTMDDKLVAEGEITVDSQSPNSLQRIRSDKGFKELHRTFDKFGSRAKRDKNEMKCGTFNTKSKGAVKTGAHATLSPPCPCTAHPSLTMVFPRHYFARRASCLPGRPHVGLRLPHLSRLLCHVSRQPELALRTSYSQAA